MVCSIRYPCSGSFYIRRFAATAAIGLLFLVTLARAQQWGSDLSFTTYEALHHPDSARASYSAGRTYANLALAGQPTVKSKAFHLLERAAHLDRLSVLPDIALVMFSYKAGGIPDPHWLEEAHTKLTSVPISDNTIIALRNLVECQQQGACKLTHPEMVALFESGLKSPYLADTRDTHAALVSEYGLYVINVRGDFGKGKRLFEQALALAPGVPNYRIDMINLLVAMKEYEPAREQLALLEAQDRFGALSSQIRSLESGLRNLRASLAKQSQPHR